jgi:hypothetical protein
MTDHPVRDFDPERLLRILGAHGVRFVLIGGWAAKLLGSPTVTGDIDICYARDAANLERLAAALAELHVRLRGAPAGLPFRPDSPTLAAGDVFTLVTDAGDLDLLGSPSGVGSFEDLDRAALALDLDGQVIRVASIDDLIRMKRAAGRPKDLVELEILGALRAEMGRSDDAPG